jgi:hypothetical protein
MSQELFTLLDRAAVDADAITLSVDEMIRSGRRRRRGRFALVSGAVTATVGVVAAGAVLLPQATTTTGQGGSTADQAAEASAATCEAASYWYTRSQYRDGGPLVTRQIWLGQNGPGRLSDSTKSGVLNEPAAFGSFSWQQLCSLTTDVPTLYALLRTDAGDMGADKESETFKEVGDLLTESPAPLGVRLALLDVAIRVPGAKVTTGVHDSLGRVGTAVSRVQGDDQGTIRYVIDPSSGELLEETFGGGLATYLASGPVPDTTAVVAGGTAVMTASR